MRDCVLALMWSNTFREDREQEEQVKGILEVRPDRLYLSEINQVYFEGTLVKTLKREKANSALCRPHRVLSELISKTGGCGMW